jgi:hypothetical protein
MPVFEPKRSAKIWIPERWSACVRATAGRVEVEDRVDHDPDPARAVVDEVAEGRCTGLEEVLDLHGAGLLDGMKSRIRATMRQRQARCKSKT